MTTLEYKQKEENKKIQKCKWLLPWEWNKIKTKLETAMELIIWTNLLTKSNHNMKSTKPNLPYILWFSTPTDSFKSV